MSKISLLASKQVNEIEEFTLYHFNIIASKIGDFDNSDDCITLISYEKKSRASGILKAFRNKIAEDLEYVEDMDLAFLSVKKEGIYACFRPGRHIEKIISTQEAVSRVSFTIMNCLHLYW